MDSMSAHSAQVTASSSIIVNNVATINDKSVNMSVNSSRVPVARDKAVNSTTSVPVNSSHFNASASPDTQPIGGSSSGVRNMRQVGAEPPRAAVIVDGAGASVVVNAVGVSDSSQPRKRGFVDDRGLDGFVTLVGSAAGFPVERLEKVQRREDNSHLIYVPVGIYRHGAAVSGELTGLALAQVDPGASISLISTETVRRLGLVSRHHVVRATAAFNSSGKTSEAAELEDVVPMWIVFAGHNGKRHVRVPIEIRAHVVDTDDYEVLLGASDLAQYLSRVNVAAQTLEFMRHVSATTGIVIDGVPREMLRTMGPKDFSQRVLRSQLVESLQTPEGRGQRKERENKDLSEYRALCSQSDETDPLRPELFPLEYWNCLPDTYREKVKERYDLFTPERLAVVMPKFTAVDISKEDPQRTAEEPFVRALFYAYPNAFFTQSDTDLQPVRGEVFSLEVTDQSPITNKSKVRGFTMEERAFLTAKTRKMIKQGRLVREPGNHDSGVVLVEYPERIAAFKEKHGTQAATLMTDPAYDDEVSSWFRLTVDYRELNRRLTMHKFPLPRIKDLIDKCGAAGTERISQMDIEDAFFTIKLEESSRPLTGFSSHEDHYVFTCMPQGVATAAEVWAEVISKTLTDLLVDEMFFYQDDVFVYANEFKAHLFLFEQIFERMINKGMICKPSKFHANYRMMKCLGHILTSDGRYPDPELTRAITDLGIPHDQAAVRSLVALGVVAKEYVRHMSDVIAPLQDLMKKNVDVLRAWKPEIHGKALEELKRVLTSAPVLMGIDVSKEFRIHVDACKLGRGIGAVLLQKDEDGRWRPVAYWSHKLSDTERGYSATDLECKAMHDAIMHWTNYLRNGHRFSVVTDHYALIYMATRSPRANNGRILNYTTHLMGYKFSVIHRKGKDHLDADAVSRLLRHDERQLKVFTPDDLVEKGVVTTKDVAELAARGIHLPSPGIDRMTIEQSILAESDEGSNTAADRESNQELIERITLRHELEQANGLPDDQECFDDYYSRIVSESVEGSSKEERLIINAILCNALTVTEFLNREVGVEAEVLTTGAVETVTPVVVPAVDLVNPGFQRTVRQRKMLCVRFSPITEWRQFYDMDTPKSIDDKAGEQSRLQDDLVVRKAGVAQRQQRRHEKLKRGRAAKALDMAQTIQAKLDQTVIPSNDDTVNEDSQIAVLRELLQLGLDEGDMEALLSHFPPDMRSKLRPIVGRILEHSAGSANIDSAVEVEGQKEQQRVAEQVERYQHLIGETFVDDENRRKYTVVSISWHEEAQCVVASRAPADGLPPAEVDQSTFVVDCGTDNCVLALVERYQIRHPEERRVEWIDESAFLLLQQGDPQMSDLIEQVKREGQREGDVISMQRGDKVYQLHNDGEHALRVLTERVVKHNDVLITQRVSCLVVPKVAIAALLDRYHDRYGHPGHDRMYRTLVTKYFWTGMNRDIAVNADGCLHCQQRKRVHSKRMPILSFPRCDRPFQRCHIDLCGPFVTTRRDMRYILVFKDYLTKWVEIFALPNKSEFAVAECFVDEIILRHGAPSMLMSDQGSEFVNKVIDQISVLLRIRRVTTSPYHPRADGLAENMVGTMKDALSAYVNVFQNDWDDYLAVVAHYYRTTVNSITGFTPYCMMYGRECKQPDELWVKSFSELAEKSDILVTDYVRGLTESMLIVWELIGSKLEEQAQSRNERLNKQIKNIQHFQPGDLVWLERPPQSVFISADDNEKHKIKKSLRIKFCGPYEVIKKISPITYLLNVEGKTQHHTIDRMKAYKQRALNRQTPEVEEDMDVDEIPVPFEPLIATDGLIEPPIPKKRGRKKKVQPVQVDAQVSCIQVFRVRSIRYHSIRNLIGDIKSKLGIEDSEEFVNYYGNGDEMDEFVEKL